MKNQRFMTLRYRSTLLAGILLCGVATPGVTSANLITNGSFEAPVVPQAGYVTYGSGSGLIDNWVVVGSGNVALIGGSLAQVGSTFPAQVGNQWLDLTGLSNTLGTGVKQTVSTSAGTVYDLSFYVGNIVDSAIGSPNWFGNDSTVEVFINGVSKGNYTNSSGNLTLSWQQFQLSFMADTGTTSSVIEFHNLDGASDNSNGLDNVVLIAQGSATVPEPATMLLFGAGIAGLAAVSRRKKAC